MSQFEKFHCLMRQDGSGGGSSGGDGNGEEFKPLIDISAKKLIGSYIAPYVKGFFQKGIYEKIRSGEGIKVFNAFQIELSDTKDGEKVSKKMTVTHRQNGTTRILQIGVDGNGRLENLHLLKGESNNQQGIFSADRVSRIKGGWKIDTYGENEEKTADELVRVFSSFQLGFIIDGEPIENDKLEKIFKAVIENKNPFISAVGQETGIILRNSLGDELFNIPDKKWLLSDSSEEAQKARRFLSQLYRSSRREILIGGGISALATLACMFEGAMATAVPRNVTSENNAQGATGEGSSSGDTPQQFPETSPNDGQFDIDSLFLEDETNQLAQLGLDEGTNGILEEIDPGVLARLVVGERYGWAPGIENLWETVGFPGKLANALEANGIKATGDWEALKNRNVNGGYSFYVKEADLFIRLVPKGSPFENLTRNSVLTWRSLLEEAGVPAESINSVALLENVTFNKNDYLALVTPNVSSTNLEHIVRKGSYNNEQITILLNSYRDLLVKAAEKGYLQADTNFTNIKVDISDPNNLRPIPIDLIHKPIYLIVGQEQQYVEKMLAKSASKRGINLPWGNSMNKFDSFDLNVWLPDKGIRVTVKIPHEAAGGLSGEAMSNLVYQVEDQIIANSNRNPGETFDISITGSDGRSQTITLRQPNISGREVLGQGGRLGKLLRGLSKANLYLETGILMAVVYQLLSEFEPRDYVPLEPVDIFPTNAEEAIDDGEFNLKQSFERIHDHIISLKLNELGKAVNDPRGTNNAVLKMCGMDNEGVLGLINYFNGQSSGQGQAMAIEALKAQVVASPAIVPARAVFRSQAEIIYPSQRPATNIGVSAIELNGEKIVIFSQLDGNAPKPLLIWIKDGDNINAQIFNENGTLDFVLTDNTSLISKKVSFSCIPGFGDSMAEAEFQCSTTTSGGE
ncbi:hypothetical protein A2W14_04130 [Candidatus Gottesmanbacteria bacterium RBG_16_37_8]|uniref:Uncharacterized protein n=1 Tax=Candidatus Gottesmanbacteria bacterium RBG_16_37_8 TaxID=1798371 RepID=A0A1F5YQ15_9BACT|nr:MAG: hypothetical protein A2W14_04130 [Candidatus Gottesmanbacteria bacterium RBG_16_37_8]